MKDAELTTLWIGSFRYYLGRMTYAVSDFTEILIRNWDSVPIHAKSLIERELKETFIRDDEARALGREYRPLGMDCDRKQWERVLSLFETNNRIKQDQP